jgi:hypothetical protein
MAWEPWLSVPEPEKELPDPDDPGLLINILTQDMTEEEHEDARRWIARFITAPADRE